MSRVVSSEIVPSGFVHLGTITLPSPRRHKVGSNTPGGENDLGPVAGPCGAMEEISVR